jgi:Sulfatase
MQQLVARSKFDKALKQLVRAAKELGLFLLFVGAYLVPLFLDDASNLQSADLRVRHLLGVLFTTSTAQIELARNLCGHFLLLGSVYAILSLVSKHVASATAVDGRVTRFLTLVVAWLLLVSGNAQLFPKSDYSVPFSVLAHPALAYSMGLLLCGGLLLTAYRLFITQRKLVATICAIMCAAMGVSFLANVSSARTTTSARNIILIGVDSMSASAFNRLKLSLPNLATLIDSGVRYDRAYTPLGRTFPAWMSILSGKSPAEHGAIFNLRNMDHVDKRGLISSELQSRGYRTIYAIDERRFNNMDQSFGFDYIVAPSAGALDFIIQRLNDTPLSNLLLQTRAGKLLMPFSYINTASPSNYDAKGFVESILNRTAGAEHLFLAAHFESAHFPFATRHAKRNFDSPDSFWNSHAATLTVVDEQVGQLVTGLAQQGHLKDALVIVLSDHGEGLGHVEASLTLGGKPMQIAVYGHGADVLSDHANHIVLAVAHYKDGRASGQSVDMRQVSLLDLKPLISRYNNGDDAAIKPSNPCMFVETGLRFTGADDYKTLDESNLAASAAGFYEIDELGRMRLREDRLRELASSKDIGVRCKDRITYFSFSKQRYFSIQLDESGLPSTELPLDNSDVKQIEAYRPLLLNPLL